MRVITYSRVSTTHHDQNPDIQVQELRRFCGARGWPISDEIIDHVSGGTDQRPGLQRLFAAVELGQVDLIIVVKLDRLFRSLRHLVVTLDDFSAKGVQFVAVRDNIDYTTPAGRLMIQILGSLAEFERSLLRERTLMGLEYAKASGKTLGRPPHPRRSEIIALFQEGYTYRQIHGITGAALGTISGIVNELGLRRGKS
ncbi:recombinase family protein [Bdellovibrio bacteriovorus]|uniref:recombinase family protein n=1 Tax=Bdellovibrio bacteriovorus TaxID=959 RepID=UPI0035A5CA33